LAARAGRYDAVKLLVTGCAGQLGVELMRQAPGSLGLARDRLDISDREAVAAALTAAKTEGCAIVVNAAAYTGVDKAESDRANAFAVNRDGPGNLAEACARLDLPLIHVSTDYVFDGSKHGAYVETDRVAPLGVYGASKEAGERAVRGRLNQHLIVRTSWVYAGHSANFVKTMLRLAGERDELRVVDDQHGIPTSAGDIARAILAIADKLHAARAESRYIPWGTYHYAAIGPTTWCGFARAIVEWAAARTGRRPKVTAIATAEFPTPARRPANSVLDCARIEQAFAPPRRPWQDGLNEVLDQLLAPKE
jgi:dTDP-4-dehydrorhamnose reductase